MARATFVLFLVLGPMALAGPVGSHNGQGGQEFLDRRLEGEDYRSASPECEEDPDVHTQVLDGIADASGSKIARMVGRGCEIAFEDVWVPHLASFESARIRAGAEDQTLEIEIRVDGVFVSSFDGRVEAFVFVTHALRERADFAGGYHDIQLWFDEVGPEETSRLNLDYLELSAPPSGACPNRLIPPPTITTADGFGDGDLGWTDALYHFRGEPTADPEGDPLSYEWIWDDGTQEADRDLLGAHAFAEVDTYDVVLRATDNPRARCPDGGSRRGDSEPFTFRVTEPWDVRLDPLQTGTAASGYSCAQNVKTGGVPFRFIVGTCQLTAKLEGWWDSTDETERVEFLVDGRVWWIEHEAPFRITYDSTAIPAGHHVLVACAYARNDRFDLARCNRPHEFENVNPFDPGL